MDILQTLFEKHFSKISHKGVAHKKLIICFAGISGSGKTTLAKLIEERYKGLRISNDELRALIKKMILPDNEERREVLVKEYLASFLSKSLKNGLIILDSGIERKYAEIRKLAKAEGYEIFIINLNTPLKVIQKHITFRSKEARRHFEMKFNDWKKDYLSFTRKVTSDVTIKTMDPPELNRLFKRLDRIIN